MRVWKILVSVVLVGWIGFGCKPAQTGKELVVKGSELESVSSGFSMPAIVGGDDGVIALSSYEGQVVLLDFWATWCPPCRHELPYLNKIYADLKEDGFALIGMTVDRGELKNISTAVKKLGLTYPTGLADEQIQTQFGGIRAVPTKFLLDRTGQVQKKYEGVVSEEELRQEIGKLLAP